MCLPLLLEKPERLLMPVPERVAIRRRFLAVWSPAREHRRYTARSFNRLRLGGLALVLLTCGLTRNGHTQRIGPVSGSDKSLPDPPGRSESSEPTDVTVSNPQGNSSISGTVLDANGGALSGARVTLADADGGGERTVLADNDGKFAFGDLPAGTFKVTITSAAMETFVRSDIVLGVDDRRELPPIVLAIAGVTTEVQVDVTQTELAQEQIKAAERQRVLGILPNFYSSYIWDAAALNSRQKFNLAFHSIADPVEFLGTGVVAGAEQATNTFSGYGQGAQGYAKRYGAAYADDVLGRMIGSAILPSLFHQDPRYFYKGSGTVRSRIFYAISRAVVTRGDDGRMQPNYSHVLGSFAAGGISNLYHPAGDRGVSLTLSNGLIETAGSAADNLLREFLLRKVTPNVPGYEKGKP
jgi:Carboxypeptidase regulatory-like domain